MESNAKLLPHLLETRHSGGVDRHRFGGWLLDCFVCGVLLPRSICTLDEEHIATLPRHLFLRHSCPRHYFVKHYRVPSTSSVVETKQDSQYLQRHS